MAYIVAQKVVRDKDGLIISGSASIVESVYISDKSKGYHCRHTVRERLGKVLWLSQDKKKGVFMSPTRGLVEYDSVQDEFSEVRADDSRLSGSGTYEAPPVHTVFGDVYLLLSFLRASGMTDVFKKVFPISSDRERLLCHVLHGILKDASRIGCSDFIVKSAAAHILQSLPMGSLDSDTAFFTMMGNDQVKLAFFKALVTLIREKHPSFGKCTYVDSTPLPNEIAENPMNFLCSHGIGSVAVQTRLIFILDKETGLPVWFHVIPGNILDFSTVQTVLRDIACNLDIKIEELVLDAGYVTKELLEGQKEGLFRHLVARMPSKKGFPYMQLYKQAKSKLRVGRHTFVRGGHVYFGERKSVEIFGLQTSAYVYVDWLNADSRRAAWEAANPEEAEKLKPSEKDWLSVRYGFFVLLSDKEVEPSVMLDQYFERTYIETAGKTSKDYEELLPLSQWSYLTVTGKILYDIIKTIIILQMRKDIRLRKPGEKQYKSLSSIIGKAQSLMCTFHNGMLLVETPSKQTREAYGLLGVKIPSSVKLDSLRKGL